MNHSFGELARSHSYCRSLVKRRWSFLVLAIFVGISCGAEPQQAPLAASGSAPAAVPLDEDAQAMKIPVDLRTAYIRSRQQEGETNPDYYFATKGTARVAQHQLQGYRAELLARGLRMTVGDAHLEMALRAHGCGRTTARASEVKSVPPQSWRHRAEYQRAGLVEWYENGPLGLEQGFTVPADAGCGSAVNQTLWLELELAGTLKARISSKEQRVEFVDSNDLAVLYYADLSAQDADGQRLPARLQLSSAGTRLFLEVTTAAARYPLTIDPLMYTSQGKLTASDYAINAQFGFAVALSTDGNTALVGAYGASPGGTSSAGAAYVFTRSAGTWTQQQRLSASDKAANDRFGSSVALSGDGSTALVGAYQSDPGGTTNAGAAYVFTRSLGVWSEQQKLVASDRMAQNFLGISASLSKDGNTALIGAYGAQPGGLYMAGAAYVYTRSVGVWTELQKLSASNMSSNADYGYSVALSSDSNTALVGAFGVDTAYVYARSGGIFSEQQKLNASDRQSPDEFGLSVALSGDGNTSLVGADWAGSSTDGAGYIYTRSLGVWTEQQKLISGDTVGRLGIASLSEDGNTALLGARLASPTGTSDAGAAYVFLRSMGMWGQPQRLTANPLAVDEQFGYSVALSGDAHTAIVGAWRTDIGISTWAGAAYVFVLLSPEGTSCGTGGECVSGNCVDGVCCDTACAGGTADCQSCLGSQTGMADGKCAFITPASGYRCRPPVDECDQAEMCSGVDAACPSDRLAGDDSMCSLGSCQAGRCRAEADLGIAISGSNAPEPTQPLTYSVSVKNLGRIVAPNVTVDLTWPESFSVTDISGTGWFCQIQTPNAQCTLSSLSTDQSSQFSVLLNPPSTGQRLILQATVHSAVMDPVMANNTATLDMDVGTGLPSGCACHMASGSRGPGVLGLAAIAGVLLAARRRRRTRGSVAHRPYAADRALVT